MWVPLPSELRAYHVFCPSLSQSERWQQNWVNFSLLFHNFMNRRILSSVIFSNLGIWFFLFLNKSLQISPFYIRKHATASSPWQSVLPGPLLLGFGAVITYHKSDWNTSTVVLHSDTRRGSGEKHGLSAQREERFIPQRGEGLWDFTPLFRMTYRWKLISCFCDFPPHIFWLHLPAFSDRADGEKQAAMSRQCQSPGLHKCQCVWL